VFKPISEEQVLTFHTITFYGNPEVSIERARQRENFPHDYVLRKPKIQRYIYAGPPPFHTITFYGNDYLATPLQISGFFPHDYVLRKHTL